MEDTQQETSENWDLKDLLQIVKLVAGLVTSQKI